jgi:hypothetical protein
MKLYLKRSVQRSEKRVGWRTPGKSHELKRGYVFKADEATDVPAAEGKLLLAQNAHLLTEEKEMESGDGSRETAETPETPETPEIKDKNGAALELMRELAKIEDLGAIGMKELRGYAKVLGVPAPATITKVALVADINEKCAALAAEL